MGNEPTTNCMVSNRCGFDRLRIASGRATKVVFYLGMPISREQSDKDVWRPGTAISTLGAQLADSRW